MAEEKKKCGVVKKCLVTVVVLAVVALVGSGVYAGVTKNPDC